MSKVAFEQWCAQDSVRITMDKLLSEASGYFSSSTQYVLQIQGEPFRHASNINFIHLHSQLQSYRQAYSVVADPDRLPFLPKMFDVVVVMFPFETLDKMDWIEEVSRVLSTDGYLVVVGINPHSIDGICDRLGIHRYPSDRQVVNPYQAQERIVKHGLSHMVRFNRGLPWRHHSGVDVPEFKVGGKVEDVHLGWFGDWKDGVVMLDIYRDESYAMVNDAVAIV